MKTQTIELRTNESQSISKILILFMIFSFASNAQTKGIKLINKTSNDSIFISENSRIEIETIRGKEIVGKYTITNDSVINIKKKLIDINTILSLKEASTGSDFLRTASTVVGSILIFNGIISSLSFGGENNAKNDGKTMAVIGVPLLIIPLVDNKHQNKKWQYVIVNQ